MNSITLYFSRDLPDVKIGTRLYAVVKAQRTSGAVFRGGCPICDDTKKITVRGKEFPCPECTGTYAAASAIALTPYTVAEYIVNGLEVTGGEQKSLFPEKGNHFFSNVYYSAFNRYGRASSDYSIVHLTPWSIGREYFLTKKEAEEECRKKHDEQKKKLEEFNEAHGTHYEYPFIS